MALGREPAETDCGPPEPVGIARAGGLVPEPERDVQRVDLVRRREDTPRLCLRERSVRRIRQVLLVDRSRDRLRVTGEPRVLGADVTLELRELANELGRLIRLGQSRSLERRLTTTERLDELRKPPRLVGIASAAGEERDRTEPLRETVEPHLEVTLERERRVLQPPTDDVLETAAHRLRVSAVRDEGKAVLPKREGADVVLDRGLDDPARKLQIALVEPPVDDDGVLDQEDDLLENAVRVAPAAELVQ